MRRIGKLVALRVAILRGDVQRLHTAALELVVVVESGGIEDVEVVTSRRTPTRRRVDEGRPSKSLLAISLRHYSPSAEARSAWSAKIRNGYCLVGRGWRAMIRLWAGRLWLRMEPALLGVGN